MRRWAALLTAAALAACSNPPTVLDASSPDSFHQTSEQARRDLSIRDRLTFDAALKAPPGNRFSNKDADRLAMEAYAGMTASEVVADARARGIQ